MTRPRVLIEDWLPIAELGIESRREAAPIPGQFPKLKTLHVWWARRPLAASAGVVLASVMPAWSEDVAARFPEHQELASQQAYQAWFLKLCGILGDPIRAKAAQLAAISVGVRIPNPYTYRPAFKNRLHQEDLALLHALLESTWGQLPVTFDPTAGGGSIPYEAIRYGLPSTANDLNGVAAVILRAGVEMSARFGVEIIPHLQIWGPRLVERVQERLSAYFPAGADEEVATYLFARTVHCPRTGKIVPLSPNWWISKETGKQVAVRVCTHDGGAELDEPTYEILFGKEAVSSRPDQGTVAGGNAVSPWDGLAIDSEYIKAEAQAGRMGSVLYAVAIRRQVVGKRTERTLRPPTATDREALIAAEKELARLLPDWLSAGVVPVEEVPDGNKTRELLNHGMSHWRDMFSPRQLLVHGTFVEEFQKLIPEVRNSLPTDQADAVLGLLALMQGKALNYNSRMSIWHSSRNSMANTFDRHDFAFKWSHAEFEGARELFPWCLSQLVDAYGEIADLLQPVARMAGAPLVELSHQVPGPVSVMKGSGANLAGIATGSQTFVCMDPPYYNNVMYGELSDFFGVWEQHTVGQIWPDLMPQGLADLKNEAVTNVARFADAGRRKQELADADYEVKMQAIFAECHRVLADAGVLTVMFTHKRADAWDALGMGLMEAGFTIETSWPVNTESEQSLHQAKKNSAASTIMLVCRKRANRGIERRFFEDIEGDVRLAARDAAIEFQASGIDGVDLILANYGPALSVISEHWPVYSSEAGTDGASRLLRPDEALDAAREEVVKLRRQALIGHAVDFDPLTDFALLAWSIFKAASFPYDEARRLALAVGGQDVEDLASAKILTKQSGTVTLTTPKERLRRRGDDNPGVHPDADALTGPTIDAVHTVLYVAAEDGLPAAKALIDRTGLASDRRFLACIQGLVRAIPRTKDKGKFVRSEAAILDDLVTAYFPDVELPEDEASDRLFSPLDL
jgi:adenine-specific DNA methylase